MSKIALTGNASGSGTFTLAAPNSDTDRTLTLPDEAGTVLVRPASLSAWPAFRLGRTSNQSITSTDPTKVTFDTTIGNDGTFLNAVTYSSGDVTVPVTGVYQVNVNMRLDSLDGNYCYFYLTINNQVNAEDRLWNIEGTPSTDYQHFTGSATLSLTANDTLSIYVDSNTDSAYTVHQQSEFSGHLIAAT